MGQISRLFVIPFLLIIFLLIIVFDSRAINATPNTPPTTWYNVKDYGSMGDGATNDTVAIQTAIDAAQRNPQRGGIVFFPTGTYLFDRTLNVHGTTAIVLRGAGLASILRWVGGNNTTMIKFAGTADHPTRYAAVEYLQVQDLTGNQVGLSGLTFGDPAGRIFNVTVRKVTFNAIAVGVVVNTEGDEFSWYDNWFTGGGVGVRLVQHRGCVTGCATSNQTFIGNHFQNLSDWAISLDRSAKVTIIGNTIQSNAAGAKGIQLDAVSGPVILSNYFEWEIHPTGTAISINPQTAGGDNLGGGMISGNVFNLNNATTGLLINNIAGLRIGPNAWRLVTTALTIGGAAKDVQIDPQSSGTGVATDQSVTRGATINTGPVQPVFHVNKNRTPQLSVSTGTDTQVTWNNKILDNFRAFSNNGFTVPNGYSGTYFIGTTISWSNLRAGETTKAIVYKNGTPLIDLDTRTAGATFAGSSVGGSVLLNLLDGDFITIHAFHNGVAARTILGTTTQTYFWGIRVGG